MRDPMVEKWRERVERWSKSGLPMAEFARREGVTAGQFGYWKKRVAALRAPSRSTALVPVVVTHGSERDGRPRGEDNQAAGPQETASHLEVVVGAGLVVRVEEGFSETLLASIVRVLGRAGAEPAA